MGLQMRPKCEQCGRALSDTDLAFICANECTYCDDCALRLQFACKNCQGELVRRPKRRDKVTSSDCGTTD